VVVDLVLGLEDRLDGRRVGLHAPGGHEEGLGEAEAAAGLKVPRHGNGRPVASHSDRVKADEAVGGACSLDQAV
jgi:hypothetical protein